MEPKKRIATRLLRVALTKAGLTEDEADSLIQKAVQENEAAGLATLGGRLSAIEGWVQSQPGPRQKFLLGLVSGGVVAEITPLVSRAVVSCYDDVVHAAKALVNRLESQDAGILTNDDRAQLEILKSYSVQEGLDRLKASGAASGLLAVAFEHFQYLTHGEFLHRAGIRHYRQIFGSAQMVMSVLHLTLTNNLLAQGRDAEARLELRTALRVAKTGKHLGKRGNYEIHVGSFENLFAMMPAAYVCPVLRATVERVTALKSVSLSC